MNIKKRILIAIALLIGFAIIINSIAYIITTRAVEPDLLLEVRNVTMNHHDAESVLAIVGAEGFDNAFRHYSTYRDINDTNFHELRKNYVAAADELAHYLNDAAGKAPMKKYETFWYFSEN